MTRRRYYLLATCAVLLPLVVIFGAALAVDLYFHSKYADLVGLNVWGYRGPAVGSKQPREWRLEVLGESTAFGYGVHWRESFPAYLQDRLNTLGASPARPVTVVNLAYNNEGAHSYSYTLDDYQYLDADAVLFYSGYNDLEANTSVFRHRSGVFLVTGYFPIFPLIFQEKAMAIRWGGRLEDAYWGRKTTFSPTITQRATASALERAVKVTQSLDVQLGGGPVPPGGRAVGTGTAKRIQDPAATDGAACGEEFAHYCGEMSKAIALALSRGQRAMMVTQPYFNANHQEQQRRLLTFLEERFHGDPQLRFVNLGETVTLKDPTIAYDGMHLTSRGNQLIAAALEPHVRSLMR